MSDTRTKNFKIYLRQILDTEVDLFIKFAAPSQKAALKRGIVAIRSGQVANSTVNRHVDKYIQLYRTKDELKSLIDILVVRAQDAESLKHVTNTKAIKSGEESLCLSLADENGRYVDVPFELHELSRNEALEIIEISEFNARDAEMLKPQDVAGLIKTLPKGQREPAWAYRLNGKLFIFDGLRRFTAFKLSDAVRTFKIYVTDVVLNIYMYASYDNLSEEKLERTPYEQGKFWLALAEKDGLRIGDSFNKDEKSPKEDVQDFCLRFNISYNTFAKYIRLLALDIEWRKAMPFTSTLTIKQLESLLKLQKKCNELKVAPSALLSDVEVPEFNSESSNKTENNKVNAKLISNLTKKLNERVDNQENQPVKRELYRSGDANIQLQSIIDAKGRSVDTITFKRLPKKEKEMLLNDIENLIKQFSFS